MRWRRALFGLLAVGAAVFAAGAADAMSWSRASCDEFRRSALDRDAVIRARVARTWDQRAGEEQWTSQVDATTREGITGGVPRGTSLVFTATAVEIGGVRFGFIPAVGEDIILFLDRDLDRAPGRRWVVKSSMTAKEYDRYWVPRCAF